MAEFGNTLFEGGIAPEVQRQAPVEDNSGAMLAESLGGAFQTAGSIFGQMIKGGQEADTNRILSDYRQEVVRIANAVDQGSLKASAARTHVRAKYLEYISNNPALAEEFDGINSKLLSDRGLAGVIQDKSPEEKARDSIIENAMTNGWVTANTPEGVEQGVTNMLSFKAAENKVNAVAQELKLVQSRNGIISEQQKFRAQQATLELAQTGYPWAQAQIAKAQQLIQQGGDVGEVLTMTKNDINSRLSQIQILSEGSDIAWVTKPFERLLTAFEDNVTGKTTTEAYEAKVKQIKAQQDLAMRADPEFGPIIAASEALGHSPILENYSSKALAKYFKQMSPTTNATTGEPIDNETANLVKRNIETGQAIEAIRGDITSVINSGAPTEKQKQEINTLITNHFRSLAQHYPSARDASDFQKWIEFVSDPTIGNWISGEMNGAISAETQQIVSEVIRGQYEDVLLPIVRQTLEEAPYIVNFTLDGGMEAFGEVKIGGKINREEAINMFWNGMGVEFRASDGYATNPAVRAKVEDLNRGANSVAKPLNTLIRAQAHIAGHNNYQEIWTQLQPRLFPEMSQETKEKAGAPSPTNFNLASPDASGGAIDPLQQSSPENLSLKDFNEQVSAKIIQDSEAANPRAMIKASSPIQAATAFLGLREENAEEAKTLSAFFKSTVGIDLNPAKTAWCAAFVDAVLKTTGSEGTGKLNARSYLDWGKPVDTPKVGDVVVFSRGDPNGWQGHVGFYMGTNEDGTIKVLGGNQSNSVSVSDYSADKLLGYRRASNG